MICAACGGNGACLATPRTNFLQIWQEQHEWTDFPRKGRVCKECEEWLQTQDFKDHLYNDPMPHVVGPQKFWDDVTKIGIGIFDGELLGLRCAKVRYGVDAVTEIMQGFCYDNEHGMPIKRATTEDVPETERCEECWLSLWACNAMEVTV